MNNYDDVIIFSMATLLLAIPPDTADLWQIRQLSNPSGRPSTKICNPQKNIFPNVFGQDKGKNNPTIHARNEPDLRNPQETSQMKNNSIPDVDARQGGSSLED
ncbi:hypothetical protein CDAR_59791 [Caerostris darwini]|uniref:Uncharacterized protein n=1 Tax=Caerostris darwini TaxID=1538125 RepID=A0AAV4RQZ8_9ARAC|nr:hypothetical protein CDAR_59791 [Caerostris darwini]